MKAMILAAGLGTRLRPLTDDRPKALVEIGGRTLLEIVLARLRNFGVHEVIVNAHHFADMIVAYLQARDYFGMRVEISREAVLLDTGGGLKQAAHFFARSDEPFIVHNVDVITTIDLASMRQHHLDTAALATLAVHDRTTSRYLLFDDKLRLCGRRMADRQTDQLVRPVKDPRALAFSGVHVISPAFLDKATEEGAFSIVDAYLRLAANGEKIVAFQADDYYWRDVGRLAHIDQVEADIAKGLIFNS